MSEHYFQSLEWLQKRLGRFTASEIHKLFNSGRSKNVLFGDTAMTYIRTKVAEILTQEVKEEVDFKQAEWGKANEIDAMRAFEKAIGKSGNYYGVGDPQFFIDGDWAGGSPDWESSDYEDGADFKCPYNSSEHLKNLTLKSAADLEAKRWEYYCQGQHNMKIRKWKRFHFVSYDPRYVDPRFQLKIITVYPDHKWLEEYGQRIDAAVVEIERILKDLDPAFPVITAHHDEELNATIVQ
jgi:hypothetical protein